MDTKVLTDQEHIDNVKRRERDEKMDAAFNELLDVIKCQQNMIDLNRESIKTLTKILTLLKEELICLKQQS